MACVSCSESSVHLTHPFSILHSKNLSLDYGAGIDIWKHVFSPQDELWVSEIDEVCAKNASARGVLEPRVNVLIGDQKSYPHLDAWQARTKGNFNVIVDDGGHCKKKSWKLLIS